jgi:hypothetical protein
MFWSYTRRSRAGLSVAARRDFTREVNVPSFEGGTRASPSRHGHRSRCWPGREVLQRRQAGSRASRAVVAVSSDFDHPTRSRPVRAVVLTAQRKDCSGAHMSSDLLVATIVIERRRAGVLGLVGLPLPESLATILGRKWKKMGYRMLEPELREPHLLAWYREGNTSRGR